MLFSSIPFLYYFLPIVMLLYYCVPKQCKNAVLLAVSLIFYAWGEPKYVVLLVSAITFGYLSGLLIEKYRRSRWAKAFYAFSVCLCLALLGYYKYADFFIENFNAAAGCSVPLLKIALPVGISFYIFQILGYITDVYRGDISAQRSFIRFGAYAAMFPQLVAGPIVRYADIAPQLSERTCGFDKAADGILKFVAGLAKKVLIADALGELCMIFQVSDDKAVLYYWLYAAAFALQIYFDFSGYSDMAIGLGKLLGFDFKENFNYPYISRSVTEFWRRWHISLGTWFRDYVYIPLGGNRVSRGKWFRNIAIVWFLTGFWHGASWNFILWGLIFALMLVLEKLFLLRYLEKSRILCHVYVLLTVILSFVIFNARDVKEAVTYIAAMFGAGELPLVSAEFCYYLRSYLVLLVFAVAGATPLFQKVRSALCRKKAGDALMNLLEPVLAAALLLLVTAYLVDGSFSPFLYFRF